MSKLLKTCVVILFILSISALVLGACLFQQREVLKGRSDQLESTLLAIAEKVGFSDLDAKLLATPETMKQPLKVLTLHTDNMRKGIAEAQKDVARIKAQLDKAKNDLASAVSETDVLKSERPERANQVAGLQRQIDDLRKEKQVLASQVESLQSDLTAATAANESLQSDLAAIESLIESKTAQPTESPKAGQTVTTTPDEPVEIIGHIRDVNQAWNFVVLDIGSSSGIKPGMEMLIQRGDQLIGKILISTIEEETAIGEIIEEWQLIAIQIGDTAF